MIGIGTDLVEVDRFRLVLARTPGVADRLFTDAERAYGDREHDPAERLAARFAAKEAVMKALGVGLGRFALPRRRGGAGRRRGQPVGARCTGGRRRDWRDERGVGHAGWQLVAHPHRLTLAQAVAVGADDRRVDGASRS